jgi:hypothetical protein
MSINMLERTIGSLACDIPGATGVVPCLEACTTCKNNGANFDDAF